MTTVSRGEITITNVNDGKTPYFHTAYINNTDFGNYDYSGRPNLAPNISFYELSSSYRQYVSPRPYIKDKGNSFLIDKSLAIATNDSPNVYIKNVPRLEKGATYIASVPLFIDDDYTINNNYITIDTYCVATADGTIKRLGRVQPDENCRNKWHNYTVAFSVPSDFSDGDFTPFMQIWEASAATGKISIGYDIKIERVSSASDKPTPYQPNIKDAPWYFSTVPLGENIADPTVKFPITLSKEALYAKNASEDFVLGETYTVTIKATKPASQTIRVHLGQKQFGVFKPVEGLTDTWVATVSITRLGENPKWVYLDQTPNTSLGTVQIDWLKIEKGDTRTPNIDSYKYLGNYTDFIQAGSINPTKYSWNLIKGTPSYFHTAYTNDLNFGSYDFSGRPNLMGTIKASDFYLGTGTTMTDISTNSIHVASKGTERMDAGTRINIPNLVSGKTYTISAKIKVDEGSTGDVDKIRVSYRKTPNGTILLSTTAYTAEVGKEITVQSTGTVNYSITDLQRFYLTIDLEGYSSRLNGGVTVSEIKIEEGSPATPYQPNIKGAPWHFSKTALGENIANKNTQFPIKTSEYCIYGRNNIEKYVVNQNYTVTMKVTKPASQQLVAYIDGGRTKAGNFLPVEGLVDVWKTTFTITQAHIDSGITDVLQIYQFPSETKGAVQIEWLKIEKGSESTPNIDSYKYLGSYVNFDQTNLLNPTKYSWNLIKGSDGEPAKTLILSTSSNTVKINQDSSIQSDTITLQANMQNMVGTATFSATPYIGTAPQTAITLGGTGNTRTFSATSWNKNWTSLVVTATFESFIDKQTIISVKEGKDGADSITGLLTNESVTLAADKNGTIESFSEASGTFKVFDGLSDVTGKNVAYTLKSSSGGTFNINASTGVYNMTAMNKDSATATFEATYKNIKIEKILNIAKSKAGKETYTYTKYSNAKDFGNYDYSGNSNLMSVIKASDFKTEVDSDVQVSDVGYNSIRLASQGTDIQPFAAYMFTSISSLVSGKTYTISAKVKIEEGTTGNIDKLRIAYRKTLGGTILLSANTTGAEVGKEIIIKGTGIVNYNITDLNRFYLSIGTEAGSKMNGSVIVSDIKIEEGSTATPYQPNIKDAPYYLSKVALGENIAQSTNLPVTTSNQLITEQTLSKYLVKGETYTVTLEGTKPANQSFRVFIAQDNGNRVMADMKPIEGLTDQWEATFTYNIDNTNTGAKLIRIYQRYPELGPCTIKWLKIEKGDIRTPNIDSYKYMGIYIGEESEQPHDPTQYAWSQIKGDDSTAYSLLLSSQVMSLPRGASKLVPENITISGMAQTGEKSIENINSRIVVEETTNGTTWTTKYDADALTYTYTPSSLNVLSARVKMYVAGAKNVQLDQKSINIVKDGSNGSNGSSSYTWVRYSENANGNPMTTTSNSKTKYIGIAITQTSTAPSAYSDYTWSRIKGSGGLVAKVYSNGGTNIEQSPIQINVETQSDGDIVEPDKVTWYMSKDSSVEWTAITAGNGITLNKKYIIVEPVVFLEANSISFKAQVEYNSMAAFDYMTVNNKSFDATKPLILRQPAAPLNPYPGLLWLDTSSGSGDPLDKTNPSLVYRWGKSAVESVIGTEYAHYAYANTPTGYQEDGVTPDPGFSVTYNSSQKPMYIGYCVTDTAPDPTTPSSYNWKSITTENGSEDVNGAKGIAQEKTETTYEWGWVVLSASDLEMLPWLNNEDGSTIIDWIYQITQKTSDDSIVQTVVGSEDMSKVYAKTDAVDELSSANHELSDKLEEYNKQMQDAFAGIDTTYVNKSEFEQEMNKFNFGIDKAGGVNLIRNSTGFQWEDTAPSDEMLTNPKFEGTISTTGLNDNGWVYNDTGMGQIIGAENDFPEYNIMRIGGTNSRTKYSYSKNIPVTPGQLINISGQARIPNTIGDTQHIYVSIRFYGAASDPLANSEADTIGDGQGFIYLFTDKKHNAGSIFGTDSYTVKTNNIVQDIWSNYSVNVTIPSGAAFMKVCLYNSSTTVTDYFDFRKPSVVLYSGMFDFWHKNDSANAQIRQILGDESLEELGLIAGFELKGLRYKLDQDILLPNPNTEYTLSWYANKISQSGKSKYYVKVLNTKTGAEIAVSEASADTIGYQRMSVTFSVTNTSAVTIRIGLEGEGSADATLSAAGLMINIGPYPLSWQSHHEEVYSTNVRIDSSGLKVFNSDYDGYNVMTPREFAGYYRNGEVYERVFTLNKDTTKVKKLEAQERFMMRPVQIVSVDSPTIQGWAFVGYNGEDTD